MAKIIETVFLVKCSQLIKDSDSTPNDQDWDSLPSTIEQVVQELVSGGVLVEVQRAE